MAYITTITDVLNSWEAMGVFAYLLPFLLIFAIIFGILNRSGFIGENKAVQSVIALSVGLLSLQFDYVTDFYASIFPYAGIGISILLVAVILLGFIETGDSNLTKYRNYIWFWIGVAILAVIIFTSLSDFYYFGGMGYSLYDAMPMIIAGALLVGLIWAIVSSGKGPSAKPG